MADTQRTSADILALFADNNTGDISPQDLRDGFATLSGGYGGLRAVAAAAAQTLGTTYEAVTGWDTALAEDGANVSASVANSNITVALAGQYLVMVTLSFSGTANTTIDADFHVGGVASGFEFRRKIGSGGDVGSATSVGILTLGNGAVVDIEVKADGASKDFTLERGSLVIKRVG